MADWKFINPLPHMNRTEVCVSLLLLFCLAAILLGSC